MGEISEFFLTADANPKHGSNSEAFAKRVGAAAARDGSQRVFSHMLLAPLFHEKSRCYVMGQGHDVWKRMFYGASRIAIIRKDNGKNTLNFAELGGYGGSAALTQLYYPKGGRDLDTMLSILSLLLAVWPSDTRSKDLFVS